MQALGGGLEPQGRMVFSKEATLAEGGLGYRLGGGPALCVYGGGEEGVMLIIRISENTQLT